MTAERMIKLMEEFHLPEDKPIILLIGRLTRWKGQRLMIDALEKIKDMDYLPELQADWKMKDWYIT